MVGVMAITSVELGDHGWSDWQVQLLMAAHFVGMFALAYPVGLLADRIGRRRTSLLGLGACAAGRVRHGADGRLAADRAVLLPARSRLGGLLRGRARRSSPTSHRLAERGVLTASNDLIVALCAAIASISGRRAALEPRLLGRRRRLRSRSGVRACPACCGCRSPRSATTSRRPSSASSRHGRVAGSARGDALDEAPDGVGVRRDALAALRALEQVGEGGRQRAARCRWRARRPRGTWPGCAVASATSGVSRATLRCARPAARPTAVCGSSRVPLLRYSARIAASVASSSSVAASNSSRSASSGRGVERQRARLGEPGELARRALGIASVELEEQPLEVGRDLDVHARAERVHDAARLHAARSRAGAAGCRWRSSRSRAARAACREARATQPESTLPKLPVGTRRPGRDRRARPSPTRSSHLGRDARPVDRVHGGQAGALAQRRVAEQLLDDALAVVERALDRDRVHVGGVDRRHLAPLDVAHAALGIEHDDLRRGCTRRDPRWPPSPCHRRSRRAR